MVAFYNAKDQDIYKTNKFMPQSRFLFDTPTNTPAVEEEVTESFGIPQTQAFTNSGGNSFSGSTSNLGVDFQRAVDARQAGLNDTSLNKNFLGFPSYRQGVTGADAGEYVGNNMDIPTQETFMGKVQNFLEPQSASQIMKDGYQEPRFQPGIIGTIMGKMDNYRNLPRADQAFISSQMGYTGPTIFGENNSGLGKDEFGINTRSAFGNYAEYVDKKGKSDMTDEEFADYVAGLKGLPKRMALTYRQKSVLRNKIKQDTLDQQMAASAENRGEANAITNRLANEYKAQQQRDGRDFSVSGPDTSSNPTGKSNQASSERGYAMHGADGGRAGYFFGGRVNFKNGGLASIL